MYVMYYRIFIYIGLFASLFVLPWWVTMLCVFVYGMYYVPAYEIVFLGFIADVLYGVPYVYTISSVVLAFSAYMIRLYVRL